jgi:DNA-3-methyladenine glycosylase I
MTLIRCEWAINSFPEYLKYHDEEWGVPVHNDQKHFEFLILEGAQAGLSLATILQRRAGYKKAFAQFEPSAVAKFGESNIETLLTDSGIIRNRLKIKSAINNAKQFLLIQEQYGSFDNFFWDYVNGKPIINHWQNIKEIPAKTPLSDQISKDLKKKGFTFVGSTIMYAHMQACGLVNDHITRCFRHKEVCEHND